MYRVILLKSIFTDFFPRGIKISLEYRISYFLQIRYELLKTAFGKSPFTIIVIILL